MATWYYLSKVMQKSHKSNNNKRSILRYYTALRKCDYSDTTDLSSKCRVCLQTGDINILDTEMKYDTIEELKFAEIDLSKSTSKLLCFNCYEFVKTAIAFRKIARKTNEVLKQLPKVESINDTQSPLSCDNNQYLSDPYSDSEIKSPKQQWHIRDPDVKIKEEKMNKVKSTHKVTCHICNKVVNRSYFKEHVTMHDPDHKKYMCDICGKSFRLRCAYHNHSLRHRTDFPFKCNFCPYKGRYAELLKTHMRTHTGDYRYMCTECPARFLFKSNLNSHMLKHKEPQFKCDTCKRSFHTTLAVQRHFEADHLGIKNHVCNICGKAFGYRNAMMKHQRHVHKREKLLFGRIPSYLKAEHGKPDFV